MSTGPSPQYGTVWSWATTADGPRWFPFFRTSEDNPAAAAAPLPSPRSELLWASVDLDNTLAEGIWTPQNPTRAIGPPIAHNVAKLRELHAAGYKIVVHTSRGWTDYEAIETWLDYHAIPWRYIQCGKILAAVYVDDRARHESALSWLPDVSAGELDFEIYRAENDQLRKDADELARERDELSMDRSKLVELVGLMADGYSRYTANLITDPRVHELELELGLDYE